MITWEFTREFDWCSQDIGMAEENVKIHLVSVINQDTLRMMYASLCLDAYITMWGGVEMARLETS